MGLKKYIKKYKNYETKELAKRAAKKRRVVPYNASDNKKIPVAKSKRKLSAKAFTRAIGNPYGVKFPKATAKIKKFY